MSIKETINQLATNPRTGRRLSLQMLQCSLSGAMPVIIYRGRTIRLQRTTQMKKNINYKVVEVRADYGTRYKLKIKRYFLGLIGYWEYAMDWDDQEKEEVIKWFSSPEEAVSWLEISEDIIPKDHAYLPE